MFVASLGAAELMTAYLGMRLGLYDALASHGPATAAQLADRAGIAPRYAREWLEQQAASGYLSVEDASQSPGERRYLLTPGHADVLHRTDSPFSIAPLTLMPVGGIGRVLEHLIEAYRTGEGVPYDRYGAEFRGGQAGLNKPVFLSQLPGWVRSFLPEVHRRLQAGGGRVADLACGAGWSSIGLARAYPLSQVDGFDLDEASVADARRNAGTAGVAGQVTFSVQDGADPALAGAYDLVCVFDALHDMAQPVRVLRTCRRLRSGGGAVLLLEPKAEEAFSAPASDTQRFLYAISVLHCLPVSLSERPSAGTGTVMRPATVREYAQAAGFSGVDVLPAEHPFHRLYRLVG